MSTLCTGRGCLNVEILKVNVKGDSAGKYDRGVFSGATPFNWVYIDLLVKESRESKLTHFPWSFAVTMEPAGDKDMTTQNPTQKQLNQQSINETINEIAEDMSFCMGPIRLKRDSSNGVVLHSSKGERFSEHVNNKSIIEQTDEYYELLLDHVDKIVNDESSDNTNEAEDEMSRVSWEKFNKLPHYQYTLKNLEPNLDPNRSWSYLLPILHAISYYESDDIKRDIPEIQIETFAKYLDNKCCNGNGCCYRYYFPQVNSPGPWALNELTCELLTRGVAQFADNRQKTVSLLKHLIHTLLPQYKDDGDESETNIHEHSPLLNDKQVYRQDLCICCLVTLKVRSQIDTSSEFAIDSNGTVDCGFIGISNPDVSDSYHEIDYCSPVVKVTRHPKKSYLKEELSFFKNFDVVRDPVMYDSWVVINKCTSF